MAKPAVGELIPTATGYSARIRVAGDRVTLPLVHFTREQPDEARERMTALAGIAQRLFRAKRADDAAKLVKIGADARPGAPWAAVLSAVDVICRGEAEALSPDGVTFEGFAKRWTEGELARRYPDHVLKKRSVEADRRFLRLYVLPTIGHLPIESVTLEHADAVLEAIPTRLGAASRRHVAQVLRRVLALAVYPGRLLNTNPIPARWLPSVKVSRRFTLLYPSEDRALLACPKVPLWRRLYFGILSREGLRRDELASLRWRHIDLERGMLFLDRNKTDQTRGWVLEPSVVAALKVWKRISRPKATADHHIFGEGDGRVYTNDLSDHLRAGLRTAGVTREDLFVENDEVRRALRVHDLRATFVTSSLANGKTETWVSDRTGHTTSKMINHYRRAARQWSEINLGTLSPLVTAIPEIATEHERDCPPIAHSGNGGGGGGGLATPEKTRGERGIRTLGELAPTHDFQSCAFDHSATSPTEPRSYHSGRHRERQVLRRGLESASHGAPCWRFPSSSFRTSS